MGVDDAWDSSLVPCEYVLDPNDPKVDTADSTTFDAVDIEEYQLSKHLKFDEAVLEPAPDESSHVGNVWRCRRLTEPKPDGKSLCPFHRDPEEREISDAFLSQLCLVLIQDEREGSELVKEYIDTHVAEGFENAEEVLKIEPRDDEPVHGETVARRRKMFCGARFGQFDLSHQVFSTRDRYPLDFQGAIVQELDWFKTVVDSPVLANGLRAPTDGGGNVRFKDAEVTGELSLEGLATEGKVSLSEAAFEDVLLDDAVIGELSVREATVDGKLTATDLETTGKILILSTNIDEHLSFSNAKVASMTVSQSTVEQGLSLHQVSVYTDSGLDITQSNLGSRCSMQNGFVNGNASFYGTRVDGELILREGTLCGDLILAETIVDGTVSMPATLHIEGGLRCEKASMQALEVERPTVGGQLDLTKLDANRLQIEPPAKANRHPAIRAVTLGGCRVGSAALTPMANPDDETDTVVYDLERGSVETFEEPDGSVPRGHSLYDYLRLVETDLTDVDFSVHRDRLFQNRWDLHGLREGGEKDVQLARRFETIRRIANGGGEKSDDTDSQAEVRAARQLLGAWRERTGEGSDGHKHDERIPTDQQSGREPFQSPDIRADVEAAIESSRVLSALDGVLSSFGRAWERLAGRVPVRLAIPMVDRGPPTITLNQLESTYAGAKTAADAIGENEAASAFFVREQWYIQLQNRRHIREEFPPVYLGTVKTIHRTLRRGAAALTGLVPGSAPVSEQNGPAEKNENEEHWDASDGTTEGGEPVSEESTGGVKQDRADWLEGEKKTRTGIDPDVDRTAVGGTALGRDPVLPPANPQKLGRYLLAWLSNASLRVFTRYGESPRRVLGWWLGIIIVWSGLYYFVALARLGWTDPWQLTAEQGPGFLLLSIGSFTTVIPALPILPFGSGTSKRYAFLSDDWVITLLSELEGLLGVLFISLFVLTLTRSIQR
jgi:hypothetical protein